MAAKSDRSLEEFVKLKPLTQADAGTLAATAEHMAKALADSALTGVARIRLVTGTHQQALSVVMRKGAVRMETDSKANADLEIITTPETWLAIAGGTLAPLDALTRGQMRVRGDIALGQKILRRLGGTTGRTDFC